MRYAIIKIDLYDNEVRGLDFAATEDEAVSAVKDSADEEKKKLEEENAIHYCDAEFKVTEDGNRTFLDGPDGSHIYLWQVAAVDANIPKRKEIPEELDDFYAELDEDEMSESEKDLWDLAFIRGWNDCVGSIR